MLCHRKHLPLFFFFLIYFRYHFNTNESSFKALYLESFSSALASLPLLGGCLSTGYKTRILQMKSKLMFLCYFWQSYRDIIHARYLAEHYAHFNTFSVYSQNCTAFVATFKFRIFSTFPVILHSLVITPIHASLKPRDVTNPLSVSTELTEQHGLNKRNHLICFRIIFSRIIHIVTCVSTSFILISSCIPSCECVTFCLPFFHYDIWIVSTF